MQSVAAVMPLSFDPMPRLTKKEWLKLRRAFVAGQSLSAISEATGVSKGTLSAYAARHRWSRDRVAEHRDREKGK